MSRTCPGLARCAGAIYARPDAKLLTASAGSLTAFGEDRTAVAQLDRLGAIFEMIGEPQVAGPTVGAMRQHPGPGKIIDRLDQVRARLRSGDLDRDRHTPIILTSRDILGGYARTDRGQAKAPRQTFGGPLRDLAAS